jgi:aerobic carbon-monoxide dehydrogenase medium subunit
VRRFQLVEPNSFADAIAVLDDDPEAKAIAGGTALLILIKQGVYLPGTLVNLRKIPGVAEIEYGPERGLRIGALASLYDVERHPIVRERYPVLAEACHVVANIRIRNLATIGGNVAHADYQSDPPAALVALGARVEIQGPAGTRDVPLTEFLLGAYETALEPAELVTAVLLPAPDPGWHGAYLKFTTRSSEDRPAVGVTALVRSDDGTISNVRLVIGAVTTVPARVSGVEELLRGHVLDRDLLARVAPIVEETIEPIDDMRGSASYKRRVAGALAERALERALGRAADGAAGRTNDQRGDA